MGKDKKYAPGDPLPTLLELVHQRPHLIALTGRFFEKSIHYTGVWTAARAQKPDLRMEDVVKFCHQLRLDLKNGTVPEFAVYEDGLKYFKELLEHFHQQTAVEKGKKAIELRHSFIFNKCQKLRLLSLIQFHRDVLLTDDPYEATLAAIVFRLEQQGFAMEMEKVARFVVTVKNSLKKGTLPPFVEEEDAEHFQNLINAPVDHETTPQEATPQRRSTRKITVKRESMGPDAVVVCPSKNSTRKRKADESFATPVKPPTPQPSPQTVVRLDEQEKIVIMRHCIATQCEVLRFSSKSSWEAFMSGLEKLDITEDQYVHNFLRTLKCRYIATGREPCFSLEGLEVFAELCEVYRTSSEVEENKKSFGGGLDDQQKVILMRRCIATGCKALLPGKSLPWNEVFEELEDRTIDEKQAKQYLKHLKQRSIVGNNVPCFSPKGKEVFAELLQVYSTSAKAAELEKIDDAIGRYMFSHTKFAAMLFRDDADLSDERLVSFAERVSDVAGCTVQVVDVRDLVQKWKQAYLENQPLPSFIARNKKHFQTMTVICGGQPRQKDAPAQPVPLPVKVETPEHVTRPDVVNKAADDFATPPSSPLILKPVKQEIRDSGSSGDELSSHADHSLVETAFRSMISSDPVEVKPSFVVPVPPAENTLPAVKKEVTDSGYGEENATSHSSDSENSSEYSLDTSLDRSTHQDPLNKTTYNLTPL